MQKKKLLRITSISSINKNYCSFNKKNKISKKERFSTCCFKCFWSFRCLLKEKKFFLLLFYIFNF